MAKLLFTPARIQNVAMVTNAGVSEFSMMKFIKQWDKLWTKLNVNKK